MKNKIIKGNSKYILIFFLLLLLSIAYTIISIPEDMNSDQTVRMNILASLAFGSYLSFNFFIYYQQQKKTKKKDFSSWIGHLVIGGILALLLSILFGFISLPFMTEAEGVSYEEKADIGGVNIWRFVVLYGLLSLGLAGVTLYKKHFRVVALMLGIFWLLGTSLVFFLESQEIDSYSVQDNKANYLLATRENCNKQHALDMAKSCTLLIQRDDGGHGSGFVIGKNYAVTNKHVIEGANKLTTWYDGKEKEVKVWNYSSLHDLAILKLDKELGDYACKWFDSSKLELAEELYVVGWPNEPYGESAITKGIYSRLYKYDDGTEYIQTDSAINPGNSGGPLVNECGVVGINTMKYSWVDDETPSEGFGLALSSKYVISKITQLIAEGSNDKGIPQVIKTQSQSINNNQNSNNYSTFTVEEVQIHLSNLYRLKSSWEGARGYVDEAKLNQLLDLYTRQIEFSNHLINKLGDGRRPSGDDIFMWNSIVKMSIESANLSRELNN